MQGQWGKLAGYFLGTLALSAAVTFGLPLLGGGSWLPDLISAEGSAVDVLFWGLLVLSLVIFALVGAVVIYSMIHFRAAPGDMSDGEHIHGNAKMEVVWIVVPTIIVTVVGVLSYMVMADNEIGLYDEASANKPGAAQLQVDVRGFSFGWSFRYLDAAGEAVAGGDPNEPIGELVLPVDKVVKFNVMACSGKERLGRVRRQTTREVAAHGEESEFTEIAPGLCEQAWDLTTADDVKAAEEDQRAVLAARSQRADGKDLDEAATKLLDAQPRFHGDDQFVDVNHAFWVPEARLKIDAVSGLRTFVQWKSTRVTGPEDRYQVVCAELCGSGHNAMRTNMCVVSDATWDWWIDLDGEERKQANCINLRLLSCLDDSEDRSDVLGEIAQLGKARPDAGCGEVKETVA